MSSRRLSYTRPVYLTKHPLKQAEYIIDFGQLERRSDYYRKRSGLKSHALLGLVILFFLTLFAVTGYYAVTPSAHFTALPRLTEKKIAQIPTTPAPKKVVESVQESFKGKIYSYTVQPGDSYARLVTRAILDFGQDHELTLTKSETNSAAYTIILGLERQPLHPGDVFSLSGETINDALLPILP